MISNSIQPASIIATPAGLVMRVVEVVDEQVTCEFLASTYQRTFELKDVRLLTNKERPPLTIPTPDYRELIAARNVRVVESTVRNSRKRATGGKRKKTIQQRIAAAGSNEEVLAILAEANIPVGGGE